MKFKKKKRKKILIFDQNSENIMGSLGDSYPLFQRVIIPKVIFSKGFYY